MERIRALIKDDIAKIDDYLLGLICSKNAIFTELHNFLNAKSKRIRSIFPILYLRAWNKEIDNNIIILLSSAELIHNASLLHDDVVDNSTLRRGTQTISNKYNSKLSIILGDYLLSVAVEQLLKLNNNEIVNHFVIAAKSMCDAEVLQYINRGKDISVNEYLQIAEGKTALLFSAIMKSSALISGINTEQAENFGKLFGTLFQINNDFMPESLENDLANGVRTLPQIIGIEKTLALKDNYKEVLLLTLSDIPKNIYREGIEDLVKIL